ncbi:hypothetical protein D3C73_1111540 [compost metagenome]
MNHHIQPLMLLPHRRHPFSYLPRVGQITGHRLHPPALLLQRLGGILRLFQLQIRHHHRRPQPGKGADNRQPNALRAAGHQHHLTAKGIGRISCLHRSSPVDDAWCSAPVHEHPRQNCSAR